MIKVIADWSSLFQTGLNNFFRTIYDLVVKHRVFIVVLAISIGVHWLWVFNLEYITYGDARVYVPETQRELLQNAFYIYNNSTNLGSIEISGGTKLIELVHGAFANLGMYYPVSFHFIYLYPITFLAPLAIYLFVRKFLKSEVAVFVACIVYLFNTYTLILQSAGVLILCAQIFSLFAFYFYYRFLIEKRTYLNFFATVFSLFIASTYDFRIFYIAAIISSLLLLNYLLFYKVEFKIIGLHVLIFILILGLNAHWLLAVSSVGQLVDNDLFSRKIFGSSYFDIESAITLFHRFWTGTKPAAFVNQPIPLYFWIIPFLAWFGFLTAGQKNNKQRFFIGLIALLGVFLTKQEDIPFSKIYQWLYAYMPGFNAFREASKFYFLTALGYSVLIGYFIDYFYRSAKFWFSLKFLLVILVSAIFLNNTRSLITGEFNTLFTLRYLPIEYEVLNKYLDSTNDSFRVLWIPLNSKWAVYSNQNPALTAIYLNEKYKALKKLPTYKDYTKPKNSIGNIFRQEFSNNLIDSLNVKYVILPLQDEANDDDFFSDYGKDRRYYSELLKATDYLVPVKIEGIGDIEVYENLDYVEKIFGSEKSVELSNFKNHSSSINFNMINPTYYILHGANNNKYVYFEEDFSPSWILRYRGEDGALNTIKSEKNDFGTNTFVVPDSYQDSFGDFELIFMPQEKYVLGIKISATIGILLLMFGIYKLIKPYVFK